MSDIYKYARELVTALHWSFVEEKKPQTPRQKQNKAFRGEITRKLI